MIIPRIMFCDACHDLIYLPEGTPPTFKELVKTDWRTVKSVKPDGGVYELHLCMPCFKFRWSVMPPQPSPTDFLPTPIRDIIQETFSKKSE